MDGADSPPTRMASPSSEHGPAAWDQVLQRRARPEGPLQVAVILLLIMRLQGRTRGAEAVSWRQE